MRHSKKDASAKEEKSRQGVPAEEAAPSPEAAARAPERVDEAEEPAVPAPEEEPAAAETAAAAAAADAESAGTESPEAAKLAEDFARAQAELAKAKEAYLRSVAEFDNYRRRTNEEKPKLASYAKGDLAKDLFPVLDNFKLGLEAAEKQHPEAKSITEGFAMIAAQIKNVLTSHGIVEIDPAGMPFDPNEHESLTSRPSADVPEDHVLFVHRVGYKIGDRLLRPASVVISAGPQ